MHSFLIGLMRVEIINWGGGGSICYPSLFCPVYKEAFRICVLGDSDSNVTTKIIRFSLSDLHLIIQQ